MSEKKAPQEGTGGEGMDRLMDLGSAVSRSSRGNVYTLTIIFLLLYTVFLNH